MERDSKAYGHDACIKDCGRFAASGSKYCIPCMGRPGPRPEANPWTEKDRFLGPEHTLGKAVVIVSERGKEISYATGFMNGNTFRPQRYLPGDRIGEILDLLIIAEEKHGTD